MDRRILWELTRSLPTSHVSGAELRLLRMVIKLAPSGVPSMTSTRAAVEMLLAEKPEA